MKNAKGLSALVLAFLLFMCFVTAHAELDWGVRAALTWENSEGETIVNEELLRLVQSIDQVFSGDVLRVTVVDALFDGRRLVAAWEIENLSEDQLVCLITSETEESVYWGGGPYSYMANSFLKPGEVRQDSWDYLVDGEIEGDSLPVGLRFSVLAPVGFTPKENAEGRPFMEDSFRLEMNELSQKFYENRNELSDLSLLEEASRMVATGKFELVEELDVAFDLKVTDRVRSLLPDGEAVEKTFEDFTMRVTRADCTLSTMETAVEAVFTDEETANRYRNNNDFAFVLLNEGGEMNWSDSWSFHTVGMEARGDGMWAVQFRVYYGGIDSLPESVTVCPAVITLGAEGFEHDSMEGITLAVPR